MVGYFQYSVNVNVSVYDGIGNVIGTANSHTSGSQTTWTYFSFPITYTSNAVPAKTHITIGNFGGDAGTASYIARIDSLNLKSSSVAGVSELENTQELKLFPNPAKDEFKISSNNKGLLIIINSLGQTVLERYLTEGETSILTSELQSGIYTVCFKDEKGMLTKRLSVTH